MVNEKRYTDIRREILGDSDESGEEEEEGSEEEGDEEDEEDIKGGVQGRMELLCSSLLVQNNCDNKQLKTKRSRIW